MIPKQFYLTGRLWKVKLVPLGDELHGDCHNGTRTIRINSDNDTATQIDTYYHELIHAIKFSLGWKDEEENHSDCDALGGLLLQYMKTKKGRLVT